MRGEVLVLDGDADVRRVMRQSLSAAGYRAVTCSRWREVPGALDSCRTAVVVADFDLESDAGFGPLDLLQRSADVVAVLSPDNDRALDVGVDEYASDFIFRPLTMLELEMRIRRVLERRRIRHIRDQMVRRLERQSLRDQASGLFGYGYFHAQLDAEIKRADRHDHSLSLVLLELGTGWAPGGRRDLELESRQLAKMGQAIGTRVRRCDSACRCGEGRFAVILPETNGGGATVTAGRLRAAALEAVRPAGVEGRRGVAVYAGAAERGSREAAGVLLERADMALALCRAEGPVSVAGPVRAR